MRRRRASRWRGAALQCLEVDDELPRALVAPFAVLLEALGDNPLELGREIRADTSNRDRIRVTNRVDNLRVGGAAERQPAGGHLVQRHTQREDVAPVIDWRANRLLGAHVGDGSHHQARPGLRGVGEVGGRRGRDDLRDAEVEHFCLAVRRDHYVGRLDVPVDDSPIVGGLQGVGYLDGNLDDSIGVDRVLPDEVGERVAFHQLHGDVADALRFADVVDSGHVRMGQRRRGACLGQETSPALVVGIGWQHLERDLAIEPRVTREEHLAHAASAQRRQDFIGTEMTCVAHGRAQCRPSSGQRAAGRAW